MTVKPSITVESIAVVSVPVSDQERAKEFYVDILGMELVRGDSSVGVPPGSVTLADEAVLR